MKRLWALILFAFPIGAQGVTSELRFPGVAFVPPGTNLQWSVIFIQQDALNRTWRGKPKNELIAVELCQESTQSVNIPLAVIRRAAVTAGRSVLTAVAQEKALQDAARNNPAQIALDGTADVAQAGTVAVASKIIMASGTVGLALGGIQVLAPLVRNRLSTRVVDVASIRAKLLGPTTMLPGAIGGMGCASDGLIISRYRGEWAPVELKCSGMSCAP